MLTDKEKAAEIREKRRLAAKGLKERKHGKPIDPMEDVGTLQIDTDPVQPATRAEKQEEVGTRGLAIGLGMKRQQPTLRNTICAGVYC